MTGVIELLDRFRSLSTLSLALSAFMAIPSNISLLPPLESTAVSRVITVKIRPSSKVIRKLDWISLLRWAESSIVADNAEETDEAPLPLAILPQISELSYRMPSSIQGPGSRRSQVD